VIRVEHLRCGYNGRDVLKEVSFNVERGEFIGVLGPNGAGKSTLLLALSGIIPIESGTIEVLGRSIGQLKPKTRARSMAVVSQDPDVQLPFSCREVIGMGRYPHQARWRLDSAEDEAVVNRVLRITDTETLADRMIVAVSGGERQRVVVARALAQETPLLLLDEAVSAMDVHRRLQVFRLLERLNREENLTILAVLHDVNLAAFFCRRMIFLKNGQMAADGAADDVLTPDVLEEVYQTKVLVQEIGGTGKRQVVFLP
jgi:iron complex transport system ATP-binding protein